MAVSTRNTKRYLWIGSVREVLSNSLWFVPLLLIVGYGILAQAIVAFDGALENWVPYSFTGGATSAQDLLSTIAAAILSMSTLVLSVTIVALQLASQQFSPRVMRTFFRDRGTKVAIGMLLGTFVYSILVLRAVVPRSDSLDQFVPSVAISVGFALTLVSLGVFDDIQINKPAKTGDAEKRVLNVEYTLLVNNEAAHGVAADLFGLTAST